MNVIVVAVDVGKWLGPLHYSSLTKHREPLPKCFRWSPISLNPEPAIGINSFTEAVIRRRPPPPVFHTSPFHSSRFFPLHLSTTSSNDNPSFHSAIPPFLHLRQPSKPRSPSPPELCSLSTSLVFITPSSLRFHLSISPLLWDGCSTNWDLLKMSLLTGWAGHSTALLIYPSSVLQ